MIKFILWFLPPKVEMDNSSIVVYKTLFGKRYELTRIEYDFDKLAHDIADGIAKQFVSTWANNKSVNERFR